MPDDGVTAARAAFAERHVAIDGVRLRCVERREQFVVSRSTTLVHPQRGAMGQVTRRQMARWLEAHGFVLEPGRATGHTQYAGPGVKITLPGHGPQDLTKKHVALIIRALARAGFDREQVRRELGAD